MFQTNEIAQNLRGPAGCDRAGLATPAIAQAADDGIAGGSVNRESLSENFNRELEAWARHALGANGFGDCF